MVKNKLEPLKCMLFTTGRVPTDMVRKAVMAGVGGLVSKAVPTDAAVKMANMYNLNLVCRAWPDSFTIANQSRQQS
jgi:FdhD protein